LPGGDEEDAGLDGVSSKKTNKGKEDPSRFFSKTNKII